VVAEIKVRKIENEQIVRRIWKSLKIAIFLTDKIVSERTEQLYMVASILRW